MKRQFSVEYLLLVVAISALLASCHTTKPLDIVSRLEILEGKERIEAYEEAVRELPAPELLYNKAYHEVEMKLYADAEKTALQTLESNPDFIRMRFLLLYIYREEGKTAKYIEELNTLSEILPADKEIAEMLLDAYKAERNRDGMLEAARKLLVLDPKNDKALSALSTESDYFKELSGAFQLDEVVKALPEIETSPEITRLLEDAEMNCIREEYLLPFLF